MSKHTLHIILAFYLVTQPMVIPANAQESHHRKSYSVWKYDSTYTDSTAIKQIAYDSLESRSTWYITYHYERIPKPLLEEWKVQSHLKDTAALKKDCDFFRVTHNKDGSVRYRADNPDEDFPGKKNYSVEVYDKDMRLINKISSYLRGCENAGTLVYNHWVFFYDDKGCVKRIKHYEKSRNDDNASDFRFRASFYYSYDSKDRVIKEVEVNKKYDSEIITKFRYDDKNRAIWVEIKNISVGHNAGTWRYFISYYDHDCQSKHD